jgi:hypothetical protein
MGTVKYFLNSLTDLWEAFISKFSAVIMIVRDGKPDWRSNKNFPLLNNLNRRRLHSAGKAK